MQIQVQFIRLWKSKQSWSYILSSCQQTINEGEGFDIWSVVIVLRACIVIFFKDGAG